MKRLSPDAIIGIADISIIALFILIANVFSTTL